MTPVDPEPPVGPTTPVGSPPAKVITPNALLLNKLDSESGVETTALDDKVVVPIGVETGTKNPWRIIIDAPGARKGKVQLKSDVSAHDPPTDPTIVGDGSNTRNVSKV